MENKKILVIDDTKDLNDMFALAFEYEGFSVKQGFDGRGGFEIYKKFRPDIILLDIRMPKMDGNEVLSRIQKDKPPHLLIIIFSNLQWQGEITDKVLYIKKSDITPTELVERVKRLMQE